jgi:hypothetical protein
VKHILRLLGFALVTVAAAPPHQTNKAPSVRIGDPKSLDGIIKPGSFPLSHGGKSRGEVYWRLDVDLPRHTVLAGVEVPYIRSPILRFQDGRCFAIDFQMDPTSKWHVKNARVASIDCPAVHKDTTMDLPPMRRAGMTFIGRAWDLDAYADPRSGSTVLFEDRQKSPKPLLTTSMRVLALGGMGCPDCGALSLRLFGYVGNQLTIADVEMNITYFD